MRGHILNRPNSKSGKTRRSRRKGNETAGAKKNATISASVYLSRIWGDPEIN